MENVVVDHLSRLEMKNDIKEPRGIEEFFFHDEQLMMVDTSLPYYVDVVNFLACKVLPLELSSQQRKKFLHDARFYQWDDPLLFRRCVDQVVRRCAPENEYEVILTHCYSSPYGGHFGATKTSQKVLQCGFYWPNLFKDCFTFFKRRDRCQRVSNISRRNEMSLNNILEVEIFDK